MSTAMIKDGVVKYVNDDRHEEFLKAGWQFESQPKAKKVKVETPVVDSQPTVASLDAVTEEQAPTSEGE